jgi:hypothetical protein
MKDVTVNRSSVLGAPALASSPTSTLIRWEFARRGQRLICQVDRDPGSGAFAVAVLPFRSAQHMLHERFSAVAAAFGRHAKLATHLRASGWKLTAYTQ